MKSITYVLFISCLTLLACKKKANCPEEIELGSISLLDASRASFPYPADVKRLVFKNGSGEEFYYQLQDFKSYHKRDAYGAKCKDDEETIIRANIELEQLQAIFVDTSINHLLRVDAWVEFFNPFPYDNMAADVLRAIDATLPTNPSSIYSANNSLTIVLDNRNYPSNHQDKFDEFTFRETVILHGKQYKDVYSIEDEILPGIRQLFYYNHAQGIIGFTDEQGLNLKVLDRFE